MTAALGRPGRAQWPPFPLAAAEDRQAFALRTALQAAVPLEIANVRARSDRARLNAARRAADVICARGDVLQYGGKGCAAAFAALAQGLAIGAYLPGGVTFAGLHWCAAGCDCPAAEAQGRVVHRQRDEAPEPSIATIDVAGGRL